MLKEHLEQISDRYHYVLIDCPPSLGASMVVAIVASTQIIIPSQCEYFAVKGLVNLLNLLKRVERQVGRSLTIAGILPTMFDPRSRIMRDILTRLKQGLDIHVFETFIPRSTRIVESNSCGQPIVLMDTACSVSQAYLLFVKEFLDYHLQK